MRPNKSRSSHAAASAGRVPRRREHRRAEVLLDITRTLARCETVGKVIDTLVDILSNELHAERCTIFLNDARTQELYAHLKQGDAQRELRILNSRGLAGHVFTTGETLIVPDAYADPRFDASFDMRTGFVTKSVLCVPIKTVKDDIIGVAQALNKIDVQFTPADAELLVAITTQAAVVLQNTLFAEHIERNRAQEMDFLNLVTNVTSEIDLTVVLNKVVSEVTRMLNADRSTLFLHDEKTHELFTEVGEGLGATQIRIPDHLGIAGSVFITGKTINIPHAYADMRFNPAFDKRTGYFTRSILCVPVINKSGKIIGVTQALNKVGGPFTDEDEARLRAFTAQIAIALENAKLFADVANMKNYNESMLESMSNAVLTLDENGKIVTCNAAGGRIMRTPPEMILQKPAADFFAGPNAWMLEKLQRVEESQQLDSIMDAAMEFAGERVSLNVTVLPLRSVEQKKLGSMIMMDDISNEKRMKATMSQYMDAALVDQLLEGSEDILSGKSTISTVLFSDIRGFTTLTEELGAQGTVAFLNEYFTVMVDCIQRHGGMLDKFIGDAVMAAFGIPVPHGDDEDRAVRAAIDMIRALFAWNEERGAQGKKLVDMGIGLNTDEVVSGNIGSPKRMDYTLIGDGVNVASRLESACKQYSARILISDNTYKKLRGAYRIREVDLVVVKGKTEPVGVYEVLDYHTEKTVPNLMEAIGHFNDGLQKYRQQQWGGAMAAFEQVLALTPKDTLSRTYIERCRYLQAHPPGNDWQGVWVMESK
jgi:adenylate cyclase